MTTNDARVDYLLTLPLSALRAIARSHGVPTSYTKERLARKIVSAEWYESMDATGHPYDATLDEFGDPQVGPSTFSD